MRKCISRFLITVRISVFVGDYFQRRINPQSFLCWVWWMWNWVKLNSSVCSCDETCHWVQQCGSLTAQRHRHTTYIRDWFTLSHSLTKHLFLSVLENVLQCLDTLTPSISFLPISACHAALASTRARQQAADLSYINTQFHPAGKTQENSAKSQCTSSLWYCLV